MHSKISLTCKLFVLLTLCQTNSKGQMFPRGHLLANVTFLDRANFYRRVFDDQTEVGSRLQMVHFYLNWCADTAAFSFEFRQFVRMVSKRWASLLNIGLLDCATNGQICVDFGNAHYPRLRMLPLGRKIGSTGQDLDLLNDLPYYSTVNDIRVQFIDWFSKYALKGRPKKEAEEEEEGQTDWPHFAPLLQVHSREELLEVIKEQEGGNVTVPVWVTVEDGTSILGRELMLDFSSHRDKVHLYRMVLRRHHNHDLISSSFPGNYSLPFFFSIDKNNMGRLNVTTYQLENITDISNYKAVSDFLEARYISSDHISSGHLGRVDFGETAYSTQVFWTDLHNALHYILYHEVARKASLSAMEITSLTTFLNVTLEYLSFPNLRVRSLLLEMRDWLSWQLEKDDERNLTLPIEDYLDALRSFDYTSAFNKSLQVPFSACANVVANFEIEDVFPPQTDNGIPERHFPCSLWTLFHALTVGEYLVHPLHRPVDVNRTALVATREYIVAFLGCRGCSYHFGNMSLHLREELPYGNSSVLWLWRAHNAVNGRLKGTASDVAVLGKRQFPTYRECFTCYRELPREAYFKNAALYLGYYDEVAVLDFMVKYYHPGRMIRDERWPTPDQ